MASPQPAARPRAGPFPPLRARSCRSAPTGRARARCSRGPGRPPGSGSFAGPWRAREPALSWTDPRRHKRSRSFGRPVQVPGSRFPVPGSELPRVQLSGYADPAQSSRRSSSQLVRVRFSACRGQVPAAGRTDPGRPPGRSRSPFTLVRPTSAPVVTAVDFTRAGLGYRPARPLWSIELLSI